MGKCSNCGRVTARTADWGCQWCGYPLLSIFYKKIPKTYKQLKEERLYELKPPVIEETGASPLSNHDILPLTHTLESEPEPVPEFELEVIPESEPEPVPESELEVIPESESESVPESELEVMPEPEPELVLESESEPLPAVTEVTVEELNSVYTVDYVAADTKFTKKILRVTGVVDGISVKEALDIQYIILTSAKKEGVWNVRCTFDKEYGPKLNPLTAGQTLTVQGKYDGYKVNIHMYDSYKVDILMRDCVLVG